MGAPGEEVQTLSFRKGNTICNLCREKKNLTDDHVPPQCCGNDKAVRARRLFGGELVARQVDARSGNGLKFRTLCKDCNGRILGSWDGALGDFARAVKRIARSALELPSQVSLNIQAGAVVRSVLGHIVATKVQDDEVTTDHRIRKYLKGSPALPASFKVYCWLYPFEPTVVSRDFTFVDLQPPGRATPGIVSVIKFYPLAFCLLDGEGKLDEKYVTSLHPYAAMRPSDETTIEFRCKPIVRPEYPQHAYRTHAAVGGRTYMDSVFAVAENPRYIMP